MTAKKIVITSAATVVAIVVALVAYLSFADLAWMKPRVESAVTKATGREFRIDGAFSLHALWTPSVLIEQAHLANADWGSEPTMLQIGHASARVDLWSLVSGPIRVKELRVSDVDVLIESNEDGASNLDFAAEESPEPEPPASDENQVPLILESAEISNVNLTTRAADGKTREAHLEKMSVVTDEDQWLRIDGSGDVDELPYDIGGRVGSIRALRSGQDVGLDLRGGLGRLQVSANGTLAALDTVAGSKLDVVATAEDVAPIIDRLKLDVPLKGPLKAELHIAPEESATAVKFDAKAGDIGAKGDARFAGRDGVEFEFTVPALDQAGAALGIEGLPKGDLAVSGRARFEKSSIQIDPLRARLGDDEVVLKGALAKDRKQGDRFTLEARVARLDALRAGLPAQRLEASASIRREPGRIELDPLDVKLGNSDAKGTVSLETGASHLVRARLTSTRVDLTPFLGSPAAKKKAPPAKGKSGQRSGARMFSSKPLPFDLLRKKNIDVELKIATVTISNGELRDVVARARLEDGHLDYRSKATGWGGGSLSTFIDVKAASRPADVAARMYMRDLKANLFSGKDSTPAQVPPLSVTMEIKGTGASPHEIAASADGRLLVTQGRGRLKNSLIEGFSVDLVAQLFRALNPFSKQDEYSNWECTIVALDIQNGKADISGMLAQGQKIKIVGDGDIDLGTEKLNIEFNTKPRKGVGVTADMFVTPFVKVSGTLTSPGIGLSTKGLLLSGGAAFATGGLSLLAQGLFDRVTGGSDSCDKLLKEVGGHPPVPAQ